MEHTWSYCDHCDNDVVICGTCGNNCCNGGYGEEFTAVPGVMQKCRSCASAYELQSKGKPNDSVHRTPVGS